MQTIYDPSKDEDLRYCIAEMVQELKDSPVKVDLERVFREFKEDFFTSDNTADLNIEEIERAWNYFKIEVRLHFLGIKEPVEHGCGD